MGDLFLDRYLELAPNVRELSVETGLEAYQVERVRNAAGALGTVLNNLAALGVGLLVPVTVIGDDGHGFDLVREVRRLPVDTAHILGDPTRLTPTYTKPLRRDETGSWQELNRLDVRTRGPLSSEVTKLACDRIEQVWSTSDGMIVLDQMVERNWGVINDTVRDFLAELARRDPARLMYVDSRAHLGRFESCSLKGNRSEILRAAEFLTGGAEVGANVGVGAGARDDDEQQRAAIEALGRLVARTGRTGFCTCGERGILVGVPGNAPKLVPGHRVAGPVDIVGAGDAATSGIVTGLLAGATPLEAAALGNIVASITVQQIGTTGTASPDQVRARW
ncbi:MAG TPA: PfkB family carbohydrate kinase, partial [Pirellulaceae bacterium]|nr:PfkB family carbohydrate kinase [Pirellulaceae bacterium]